VTVLCVEQNAVQSLAVSDRGVVLVHGRIALAGPASELLDNPQVSELYLGGLPSSAVDVESYAKGSL
jgi:branched-chain amino acid transport system ATP-binding protein